MRKSRSSSPLQHLLWLCALLTTLFPHATLLDAAEEKQLRPNIVLIFCDDLAYGDLGCYGNVKAKTPNLDRMAAEGMRFTDFYVGQPVCSASRAALLTGCYPNRVGIQGALSPHSKVGLNPNEITIAEILKGRGYATAIYGKWHLGDSPQWLPTRQGFDEWFGLPYSNDMWPNNPRGGTNYPPLPLYENERVIATMPDQTRLTTWYTDRAVRFIEKNKSHPFFLYVPHSMPHVPIHVSEKHLGKSGAGLYADVIMEIDWSVGEILKTLKANGLNEKTIVLFSSDNGPWLLYGNHAGSAKPLREGKMTVFDGGVREPFLARWPGRIPAGRVCRELATTMDLLPTFALLAGTNAPSDRIIDGSDIWPLLSGAPDAKSPHNAYYYYWGEHLQAVRSGPWKLHLPHLYNTPDPVGKDGNAGKDGKRVIGYELFNLAEDISETNDVLHKFPEIAVKLETLAQSARQDLGDSATKTKGANIRPAARLPEAIAAKKPDKKSTNDLPNIVFILMDDLGWADIGCNGSTYYKTPNIDRLAREGMRFTQAYAACPVCSPTRASILTGHYPAALHLTDWLPGRTDRPSQKMLRPIIQQRLPTNIVTLPKALKSKGYVSGIVGKWHLGGTGSLPKEHGFDFSMGAGEIGMTPSFFFPYKNKQASLPDLDEGQPGEYLTDRLTSEAEKFIEQNKARPFFLYLAHYAVHIPLAGKKEIIEKYHNASPSGSQTNYLYAAMIEGMDESVGRIMKKLDELNLTERTLVIFTSDNGGLSVQEGESTPATSNAPLRDGKGYLYEGGIREPLIARWPGQVKPGAICNVPVSSVDFMPTFLEIAGANPISACTNGVSLVPLFQGAETNMRPALFWHYPHYSNQGGKPGAAIRMGEFKLIEFYEDGHWELYNLADDPGERKNLTEALPKKAAELQAKLEAWRRATQAQMMKPNPDYDPNAASLSLSAAKTVSQSSDGTILLHARDVTIHGTTVRYEPQTNKNTIGYWTKKEDWVSWNFEVKQPGTFEVEILQGCGKGSGGAEVEFSVAEQTLPMKVIDTGHFQNFLSRKIGQVHLEKSGTYTLAVKPKTKPGVAVMDLRSVNLIPAK